MSKEFDENIPDEFWSNLAAAIVYRACLDYENMMTNLYLEKNPYAYKVRLTYINGVKGFFGSPWYYTLTSINHNKVLHQLEENAKERAKQNKTRNKYNSLWGKD